MRTDIRFRLGKETFGGTVCPHVTAEGRECGEECDPEGYHLLSCSPGGGYFVGHDGVCATVSNLTAGSDGIPGAIADWKPQVSVWPRATRGAEADVGFYRLPGSRDTYVDAVCSLANPETYPSCERKAGWLAEHKARAKKIHQKSSKSEKQAPKIETIRFLIIIPTVGCICSIFVLCRSRDAVSGLKGQLASSKNSLQAELLHWASSRPRRFGVGTR